MYIKDEIKICNDTLSLEIGKIARNTASSVMVDMDGTTMLITVVYSITEETDFLPLKVEYFERFYANGKIPFNYFKREGKLSEREILISRMIDRSIRSSIPKDLNYEIQITITVLSINQNINPDIIALNGTSIALSLSGLPFSTVASIKVGLLNKNILMNPKCSEIKNSEIELIVTGNKNNIIMLEGNFNEIEEKVLLQCINYSMKEIELIIDGINNLQLKLKKNPIINYICNNDTSNLILEKYEITLKNLIFDKKYNKNTFKKAKNELTVLLTNNIQDVTKKNKIVNAFNELDKKIIREKIAETKKRLDDREFDEIRKISSEINILKFTHGSAIFTRGETQSIASITLGTHKDIQVIDCPFFSCYKSNFILHYNFPPYAVNEIGNTTIIKRREIGHGNLAKNALIHIIPTYEEFPYVIRIVSEITESNGSSSMATVCSSSLALMDAGIPIKNHVAGIAMGLIKYKDQCIILTDISSDEDFFGDMDFKISGSKNGITALQMDLKIPGINIEILEEIIKKSKIAINQILKNMNSVINTSKEKLSENAPKIKILHVNKNKIKDIIGKNGTIIKDLIEKYDCDINISNDGVIRISSNSQENIESIVNNIKDLIKEIKIGTIFKGKVMRLVQFGAFINIINKTDGLLHISKINKHKINNPNWKISEGDIIEVVISNIDADGKISLSINDGSLA